MRCSGFCVCKYFRAERGAVLALPAHLLTWTDLDRVTVPQQVRPTAGGRPEHVTGEGEGQTAESAGDWRRAVTWRFPVLVTSLSPLRVYLHTEGVAWDGLTSYFQQKVRNKVRC